MEGWVGLGGWLHTKINIWHREMNLDMVTHPSANRVWCSLTLSIETNALTTTTDHNQLQQYEYVQTQKVTIVDFCWYFGNTGRFLHQILRNIYTIKYRLLPLNSVEIYRKITPLCHFNHNNPHLSVFEYHTKLAASKQMSGPKLSTFHLLLDYHIWHHKLQPNATRTERVENCLADHLGRAAQHGGGKLHQVKTALLMRRLMTCQISFYSHKFKHCHVSKMQIVCQPTFAIRK